MHIEMLCTKHFFNFGFDRPKELPASQLMCPFCAHAEIGELRLKLAEAQDHRDLLLQAIDLKKLYQPLKENAA